MAKSPVKQPKKKNLKTSSFNKSVQEPWPGVWPGIVHAWTAISEHSSPLLLYLILYALVEVIVLLVIRHPLSAQLDPQTCASFAGSILGLIFLPYMTSYELSLSQGWRKDTLGYFKLSPRKYINVYLTLLLFIPLVLIGAVLVLIPLIWIMPMFYFVFFAVVDQDLSPFKATTYVWSLITHNLGRIWAIIGLLFLIGIVISALVPNRAAASIISATCSVFLETTMASLYNWIKASQP